jgi:hypothetical protein
MTHRTLIFGLTRPCLLVTALRISIQASAADGSLEFKLDALPKIDITQFVGAERCAKCHESYFAGWKTTLHSKMVHLSGNSCTL